MVRKAWRGRSGPSRLGVIALAAFLTALVACAATLSFEGTDVPPALAAVRITPPPPTPAPRSGSITVDPTHGLAGDQFTAIYAVTPTCPDEARFFYDGAPVATGGFDTQCRAFAVLSTNAAETQGPHTVAAIGCIAGTCDAGTKAAATYTVDPPPTPTPTASAAPTPTPTPPPTIAPTPRPTPKPTPARTATPSLTPVPTPHATPQPTTTSGPTPTPIPSSTPSSTTESTTSPARSSPPSPTIATAVPTPTPGPTTTPSFTPSTAPPASATPIQSPTPATTPSPTPPASAVVAPVATPIPPGSKPRRIDPLPVFAQSIPGPQGAILDFNVVATNLLLTALVVLLFGLTSAVFNSTIDDNRDDITRAVRRWARRMAPLTALLVGLSRAGKAAAERAGVSTAARVIVVLLLTGLIYGFLSPDFGLNSQSLFLFIALVIGLGFGTYLQEGGSTLLAVRRYHVDSSVRLFGAGIVVAIVCVLASRLAGLQPGFVYGFIASSVILAPVALDRRASANLVILPSVALLAASLAAWIAMGPLHAAAERDGSWFNVLADTIAASIFVGGLEGVFYSMIPLTFMDGAVVWRWSRVAWALIFGVATFLFWQLVINQYAAYLDAFRQPTVFAVLLILAVYGTLTVGTWLYFRWRRRRGDDDADDAGTSSLREVVQEGSSATA